MSQQAVIGRRP